MLNSLKKDSLKNKLEDKYTFKVISDIENLISNLNSIKKETKDFHNLNKIFINLANMQNQIILYSSIIKQTDDYQTFVDFDTYLNNVKDYILKVKSVI